MLKCPGSMGARRPEIVYVTCSKCGEEVEMFSDEQKTECGSCGAIVLREKTLTCTDWCKYAKECMEELKNARQ